jgi:hypothetical protein
MEHHFENIRKIYSLNENRTFTFEEAQELIPLFMHISAKTKREINTLNSQLSFTKMNTPKAIEIQNKINMSLQNWSEKIKRLGVLPIAEFKIKIIGKEAHYTWEYPQKNLVLQRPLN